MIRNEMIFVDSDLQNKPDVIGLISCTAKKLGLVLDEGVFIEKYLQEKQRYLHL